MKLKSQKTRKRMGAMSTEKGSARKVKVGTLDRALLSLPPKFQEQIDQVLRGLDKSPLKLQDLQALGYRVLKRATEISETLRRTRLVKPK